MDHHCSGPLWVGDTHIFVCIMVNNDTFIAYYSYPVGLICPPIQHLHDIAEANKGGKKHAACPRGAVWMPYAALCCCGQWWMQSWMPLWKPKRSLKPVPPHCPKTGLFWVQLYFLLRRGGNLGDAASEFGYAELPLLSLQPSGSFWVVGSSLCVGLYHAKLDTSGEQLATQGGLRSALDFIFLICIRKAN